MKKFESINDSKFEKLPIEELNHVRGGDGWTDREAYQTAPVCTDKDANGSCWDTQLQTDYKYDTITLKKGN